LAAFRKLALTALVLAACCGVATAGARSQPGAPRLVDRAPLLRALAPQLRPAAGGAYAGTLRVREEAGASARLFLSVSGASELVVRDRGGAIVYRGPATQDLPVGRIAAHGEKLVLVRLRPAPGGSIAVRWTAASM
jgi:hypothetical protein